MKKRFTRWLALVLVLYGSTPSLFGQFTAGRLWRTAARALGSWSASAADTWVLSPLPPPVEPPSFDSVATATAPLTPEGGDAAVQDQLLIDIAADLERQHLVYSARLGQDCSGIFHRLKDSLAAQLPRLGDTTAYEFPAFAEARSSRQIADWYYRRGRLRIVEDARAARDLLRPGAILFFGKPGQGYRRLDIERLTDRANGYSRNGIIAHIAVVVSVERDVNDRVVGYTMMHGRNRRVPASRSHSREVQSRFTKGLPPFGNWSQQWVAVAYLRFSS